MTGVKGASLGSSSGEIARSTLTWEASDMANWAKREVSKSAVRKARRVYRDQSASALEKRNAIDTVNRWRASHGLPLHFFTMNVRRRSKNYRDSVVSQRLKRMPSILNKFTVEPNLPAERIQDYGGVRIVLRSTEDLDRFVRETLKSSQQHVLVGKAVGTDKGNYTDYITEPRSSGYRSVHMVYEFRSGKYPDWNGSMIELQIRTQLQHAWSTAVEAYGLARNADVKGGAADELVLEFFRLVSAEFAYKEGKPLGPNVVANREKRIHRIKELNSELHITQTLRLFGSTMKQIVSNNDSSHQAVLLEFEYGEWQSELRTTWFESPVEALSQYELAEDGTADGVNVVLVNVSSLADLRKAYPNYFADTALFQNEVEGL